MRERRESRELTQTDLAEKIGGNQNQVKNYELGKRVPNSDTLARIARALECSADYLLGLSDRPNMQMGTLSGDEVALLEAIKNGLDVQALQALLTFLKGSDK